MIGDDALLPVKLWAGVYVEGDGRDVWRTGVSELFASREAAVAAGYYRGRIQEYTLSPEGRYEGSDW